MSLSLSRRSFLRGAGAMLSLPFLEAMLPRTARAAALAGRAPLRMGIFTVTGGTVLESWKPTAEGSLGELPSILRPLDFAKKDMLVLSGLSHSGKFEGTLNGHQQCSTLHLTGSSLVKNDGGKFIASVSIDQAAAQAAGKETFLPSLEIGLGKGENKYSFLAHQRNGALRGQSPPRLRPHVPRCRQLLPLPPWAGRGGFRPVAPVRAAATAAPRPGIAG